MASKTVVKATEKLWTIVEKKATQPNSVVAAQQFIVNDGADVRSPNKNHQYMIPYVLGLVQRNRDAGRINEAESCTRLLSVLQQRASELLSESLTSGDLNGMRLLVQLGTDCYQADKYGQLGLLGELLKQDKHPVRLDIIQFLVQNSQQAITSIDNQQQTCLSLAKCNQQCSSDVVEYLQGQFDLILNKIPFNTQRININEVGEWIRRGANTEYVDDKGNTVLCNAVITNNLELIKVLVASGSNTEYKNNENFTALQLARNATPRNAQLVAFLEKQGVNSELKQLIQQKKSQLTADEVHKLLEQGAKIDALIANNDTFLHLLIVNNGTPELVNAFVNDFGADIDAMNVNGYRPIEMCILYDDAQFLTLSAFLKLKKVTSDMFFNRKLNISSLQFANDQKRLVAAQIIQDELNLRLWQCIAQATADEKRNSKIIMEAKQLISYGAQIDHKHIDEDYDQWTVLHLACKSSNADLVRYLIENLKPDYVKSTLGGDVPVTIASEFGQLPIVQYLRGLRGTQLNIANKDKQTPLHLATKNNHLLVVRYLVLWGADHEAQNSSQKTPLEIAETNVTKSKDEVSNKKIIHFLKQLICPKTDGEKKRPRSARPNNSLDLCDIPTQMLVDKQSPTDQSDEDPLGETKKGFLSGTPNSNLRDACEKGDVHLAKEAIAEGADIRHRQKNRSFLDVVTSSLNEYNGKVNLPSIRQDERQRFYSMAVGCHQILQDLQHIATTKLIEAIKQSNTGRVIAYHQVGGQLTPGLLDLACRSSDNFNIIDYLINQSKENYAAMFNYSTVDSPYMIAMKTKHINVAKYLKYRLSIECTNAINANNLPFVKQLIRAGASVDTQDTNNLLVAVKYNNVELVQLLAENGARLPTEWLGTNDMQLPPAQTKDLNPDIVFYLNRCLLDRRLRLYAANGDLNGVIQCQRIGADINSKNCHGATALFYTIQFGSYFSVVHALVSCGASMLHSNIDDPKSLLQLSERPNYEQIHSYLAQELNVQFLAGILDNDIERAESLSKLGADFNFQDEQKRTLLHYAVQYHGIDLVKWLGERGSTMTTPDINGNYAITDAAYKGDFAVVEYIITSNPATKKLKNNSGQDAHQIAKQQNFKRIVQLLEGKPIDDTVEENEKILPPKYDLKTLIKAAKDGQVKIIREFVDQRYPSLEDKKSQCEQIISAAKQHKQSEVLALLERHYKTLSADFTSDVPRSGLVSLSDEYQIMLKGFLTGLSGIIASSKVVLDPSDPNTYKELFSNLNSHARQRELQISKIQTEQDISELSKQDMNDIEQKIQQMNGEIEKIKKQEELLNKRVHATDISLKEANATAIEKKQLYDDKEATKEQLAALECTMLLVKNAKTTAIKKKNLIEFMRNEATNLYLFYSTIEHRLTSLFFSVLTAQSGLVKTEMGTKLSMAQMAVDNFPTSVLSVAEPVMKAITGAVSKILEKIDQKEHNREWHNISTLGNIDELKKAATNSAGLLTLYYKQQIESIDTKADIKGSNFLNTNIQKVKDNFVDVRPEQTYEKAKSAKGNSNAISEKENELTIVIVAEYIIEWMKDSLASSMKNDKHIDKTKPLADQLWLCVAKKDPIEQGRLTAATDTLGLSTGKQLIPLKSKDAEGQPTYVQVRYLFGCVSVISGDGVVYRYRVPKGFTEDLELKSLEVFGYVYLEPFVRGDKRILDIIKAGRSLEKADDRKDTESFAKVVDGIVVFHDEDDGIGGDSTITRETARQVAKIMREDKIFVDPQEMKKQLDKAQEKNELTINVLRDDMKEKSEKYENLMKAAYEKIGKDFVEVKQALIKDNEEQYSKESKKLTQQIKELQIQLEKTITERMNQIEKDMKQKSDEMMIIVTSAKTESSSAIHLATNAVESSAIASQEAIEASKNARELVDSTEQRKQEMKVATDACRELVQRTIAEQKENYQKSLAELHTKYQENMERLKQLTETAASQAKDSTSAAKETSKLTREQLEVQKDESKKTIASVKEAAQQWEKSAKDAAKSSDLAANQAKDAAKEAKRAKSHSNIT